MDGAGSVGLVVLALLLVSSLVLVLPGYVVERDLGPNAQLPPAELAKAKNDARATLLQGVGGLVLLVGALAAWWQLRLGREQLQAAREQMLHDQQLSRLQLEVSRRQLEITEQGQITERFTRAVEQLASDKRDVRLGGIRGLERLAATSAVDQDVVGEILLALVHQRSPWPPRSGQAPADEPVEDLRSLWVRAADVADAVSVVGRLSLPVTTRLTLYLGRTDLRRVDLRDADLAGAWLGHSNLARAEFADVNLRGANLQGTNLMQARLSSTSLQGAILTGADLRGADLRDTDLDGASLAGAVANPQTQWPERFDWKAAGVVMESTSEEELA